MHNRKYITYLDIIDLFAYSYISMRIKEDNFFYKKKAFLYFCRFYLPKITTPSVLYYLVIDSFLCIGISVIPLILGRIFYDYIYIYPLHVLFINLYHIILSLGVSGIIYYLIVCYICYTVYKREENTINEKIKDWDVNQESKPLNKQ